MARSLLLMLGALSYGLDGPREPRLTTDFEDSMQFLLLVAAVLLSIATALGSAMAVLSLMFRFMSKIR